MNATPATDAQLLAAALNLPVFYFSDQERGFDLVCRTGGQLAFSVANLAGIVERGARVVVVDEDAALLLDALGARPDAVIVLLGDTTSETTWATADRIKASSVVVAAPSSDLDHVAAWVTACL